MENKKQDEKSLEELVKSADSFRKFFADLADGISKVLADIKAPDEEEDAWKMKCPYKYGDNHYCIQSSGDVFSDTWRNIEADNSFFSQGNIFTTKQAAELEAERRSLLTRFRAFRDECNNGWTPDWTKNSEKISLYYKPEDKKLYLNTSFITDTFNLFGYFKNKKDAQRAIELFGDEIKELFVEGYSK